MCLHVVENRVISYISVTVVLFHPGGAEAGVVPCWRSEGLWSWSLCQAGTARWAGGAEGGAEAAGWNPDLGQRAPGGLGERRQWQLPWKFPAGDGVRKEPAEGCWGSLQQGASLNWTYFFENTFINGYQADIIHIEVYMKMIQQWIDAPNFVAIVRQHKRLFLKHRASTDAWNGIH